MGVNLNREQFMKWLRDDRRLRYDQVIGLDKIWLKRSDADPKTQIFSATINPTKFNPQR